jgi:hypothetical protein
MAVSLGLHDPVDRRGFVLQGRRRICQSDTARKKSEAEATLGNPRKTVNARQHFRVVI